MSISFRGKTILVTGGGSGIGRACALLFAEAGANVCACDISRESGTHTVQLIEAAGGKSIFIKCNVTMEVDVENMVREAVDAFGRIDCAFNNAGVSQERALTGDCSEAEWERVISVNLKGVWFCMKHEIRQMLKQRSGSIVNTASVMGFLALPGIQAYVASKHGVIGLTKAAALEYAKAGIRVNSVAPGVVMTSMSERRIAASAELKLVYDEKSAQGRMGEPKEIAEAVFWLCSDSASFLNGHSLVVDGGWSIKG